jgi:hypothetical protein
VNSPDIPPPCAWRSMAAWTALALLLMAGCRAQHEECELQVRTLLTTTVDAAPTSDHDSPFLKALADLAKAQGLDPHEYLRCRIGDRFVRFNRGRAVELPSGGRTFVVVILESLSPISPGRDAELLVLLDNNGRILDKFGCDHYGTLSTEIRNPPDADGAQLVIVRGGPSKPTFRRLLIGDGRLVVLSPPSPPQEPARGAKQ